MNSLWTGFQHWVQQEVAYPLPEQCSNVLYQPGCVGNGEPAAQAVPHAIHLLAAIIASLWKELCNLQLA